jgi:hypothetical protein
MRLHVTRNKKQRKIWQGIQKACSLELIKKSEPTDSFRNNLYNHTLFERYFFGKIMEVERSQIAMSTVFLGETKQCHNAPTMSTKLAATEWNCAPTKQKWDPKPMGGRVAKPRLTLCVSGYAGRKGRVQEPTTEPRQGSRSQQDLDYRRAHRNWNTASK